MNNVVTLDEYVTLPRPNLEWIVKDLIPRPGLILLLGEAKSGKSFLALQLALILSRGDTFLNKSTTKSKVLFLQFDTSELVWRERLRKIKDAGIPLSNNVYMLHPSTQPKGMNIMDQKLNGYLRDAIRDCNPDVVIFDVLREIHNGDEQDSTAMKMVCDQLMNLLDGRAGIVLHHPRKLGELPPKIIDCARGSSYLAGKADAVWLLHQGFLHIESRLDHSEQYRAVRLENGLWRFPGIA